LDLTGSDKSEAGTVIPTFYSAAGEEVSVPKRFRDTVRAITQAVNCIGCRHSHFVRAHKEEEEANASVNTVAVQTK